MSNSCPVEYWNLINKLKGGQENKLCDNINAEKWYEHFKILNTDETPFDYNLKIETDSLKITLINILDQNISQLEIQTAISALKNRKSPGEDNITNEMIKTGTNVLIKPLQKLFNHILNSGHSPSAWNMGIITPNFKKGERADPGNYRGITLLNSLSKLFTSILKERHTKHINENNIIMKEQIGFMPKFRTADHIFVLKQLLSKYLKNKKRIFACFNDFKKAFYSIWHQGLLYKLRKNNISGKFYNIIESIYQNSLGCVKTKTGLTPSFSVNRGIRQGDNLSPLLFNLYINDIKYHIESSQNNPPTLLTNQLSCLLYAADDLLLLSESKHGLQNAIDSVGIYCKQWKLDVNASKSKIIIFNKSGKILSKNKFKINGQELENVTSYTYLGLKINSSGKLSKAQEDLEHRATKALFKMKQLLYSENNIPIKTHLKLFDSIIKPVLLYCSEVWASDCILQSKDLHNNMLPMEKLHIKFCKYVLQVNCKASNLACLLEV
uniref:RNA-directed DNA polymerase from mobile element jockey-like n=1 Tax=Saccoglossus kowalevskii TaxID=10224 RepID=A0ABM0MQP8_SACKO